MKRSGKKDRCTDKSVARKEMPFLSPIFDRFQYMNQCVGTAKTIWKCSSLKIRKFSTTTKRDFLPLNHIGELIVTQAQFYYGLDKNQQQIVSRL